jgi:hypothetical protein
LIYLSHKGLHILAFASKTHFGSTFPDWGSVLFFYALPDDAQHKLF